MSKGLKIAVIVAGACAAVAMLARWAIDPAAAADMPVKAPITLPVPLAGSGFYLGVNGGAAFSGKEYDFVTLPGIASSSLPNGTGKIFPAGVMAGATVGFGGSVGSFYAALESEFDYDFTKFETSCADGRCGSKNTWFLAQKVVIGLPLSSLSGVLPSSSSKLASPSQWPIPVALPTNLSLANVMPAAVVGIAEHDISACITGMNCGQQWTAGLLMGGQLRFAAASNWTAKIEYDYIMFRNSFTPTPSVGFFPATFKELDEQRVMFGVDYHL